MRRVWVAMVLSVAAASAAVTAAPAAAPAAPSAPAAPPVPPGDVPAETKPRLSLRAERGFLDDAWALDPTGKRLAIVKTDRDRFQRVEIHELESGAATPQAAFDLPAPARSLETLTFPSSGSGLLVTSDVSSSSAPDSHQLESFDDAGKSLGKAGPVWAFGFATAASGPSATPPLVTVVRRAGRGGDLAYVVAPLTWPALRPVNKPRTHAVGADGVVRGPGLIAVGFFDGYSKMLTQRPGAYDKKKDVRQPDGQSVLDLLTGKVVAESPIEDVYGWARTTRLRREHPNRTAFVRLTDNVGTGVELVDAAGRLTALPLAVPFRLYDRVTLADQEGPAPGLIHFGLQIDPVNPAAVARGKTDQPFLDIYSVSLARPEAARLRARVRLDPQPVVWSVAGDRLVVFRRFKSFARGGDRVDVYDLVP